MKLKDTYYNCPKCENLLKTHVPPEGYDIETGFWNIFTKCHYCGHTFHRLVFPDSMVLIQKPKKV